MLHRLFMEISTANTIQRWQRTLSKCFFRVLWVPAIIPIKYLLTNHRSYKARIAVIFLVEVDFP